MYNETYDDYIRSVLGYSNNQFQEYMPNADNRNLELEQYYPDVYKRVYPIVKAKCNECRNNVTNEDIESMTDEIYFQIEHRQPEAKAKPPIVEKRETRQINSGLRDIIKILLIRELLNRPNRPGPRPPYGRPPFGPGPGSRPPFWKRPVITGLLNLYYH